jgi:hypothetical protein
LLAQLRSKDDLATIAKRKELVSEGQSLAKAKSIGALVSDLDFSLPSYAASIPLLGLPIALGRAALTTQERVPVDPRTADAALADYTTLFAQRYAETRDTNKAHDQAIERMRLHWARSDANKGRLTLYALETIYPAVNGSHEWMREALECDIAARVSKPADPIAAATRAILTAPLEGTIATGGALVDAISGKAREDVPLDYAIVADATTEKEIAAGQPPSYQVIKSVDGIWDILGTGSWATVPGAGGKPLRYRWDIEGQQEKARDRFARQRSRIFEGRTQYEGVVPGL